MRDATIVRMATKQHVSRYDPNGLPMTRPPRSFSVLALVALLTFLAIIYGFIHAGAFGH
jgi:hypothetical protein